MRETQSLPGGVVHDLPNDLKIAIERDPAALATWHDITPLARNEWICWTITVAKPETRAKQIVVMRDKRVKGGRRPCCWIGCIHRTDKAISPSVQWALNKRSKTK